MMVPLDIRRMLDWLVDRGFVVTIYACFDGYSVRVRKADTPADGGEDVAHITADPRKSGPAEALREAISRMRQLGMV